MKTLALPVAFTALLFFAGCAAPARAPTNYTPIPQPPTVTDVYNGLLASARTISGNGAQQLKTMGSDAFVERAKQSVAAGLKDPASTQFRDVRVVSNTAGSLVCGELNSKNSYGGYAGFVYFFGNATRGEVDRGGLGTTAAFIKVCGMR